MDTSLLAASPVGSLADLLTSLGSTAARGTALLLVVALLAVALRRAPAASLGSVAALGAGASTPVVAGTGVRPTGGVDSDTTGVPRSMAAGRGPGAPGGRWPRRA